VNSISSFEGSLLDYMAASHSELMDALNGGDWNDDLESRLIAALEDFKTSGSW